MPRTLRQGERLFAEGDAADALYVLTRGSVTVGAAGGTRYLSFSPGTLFGELALLDGGGRSAEARADQDAELHALPKAALQQLTQSNPPLAAQVYRHIAVHLAERLRSASSAWREAAS